MTLFQFIIPREKRVIVYPVLNKEIINSTQKSNYPSNFQVDSSLLTAKRNELIALTTEDENSHSFVYVHSNGELETEINVCNPKYDFHENYND